MKFKTAQIHEWCSCWRTSKLLNYPNSVKDPCHIIWTSADVTPISVGFLFFSSLTDHCLLPLFGTPFLTVHRKLFHVEECWTLRALAKDRTGRPSKAPEVSKASRARKASLVSRAGQDSKWGKLYRRLWWLDIKFFPPFRSTAAVSYSLGSWYWCPF